MDIEKRHPSTRNLYQFFSYEHLSEDLQAISRQCASLAFDMVEQLPDCPELTAGLRKLLEAKDCFVRVVLDKERVDYRDR